ncbi:hypothetical protein AURDEDRAFT_177445 [Auricularia subglabra TFB-10046 SS5]|uniref:Uncharacterized protein n=1 Tax=Auricularia subglabra (strain TFB-10046 / SS5) TaxID=717982 RepID=J0D462_AURST|nr:hypothetical protein AURDEDRAFT_177445 [Auricularia subglabra TFB-10046 SS5]
MSLTSSPSSSLSPEPITADGRTLSVLLPVAAFAPGTSLPPRPEPVAPPYTSDGKYIYDLEAAARLYRQPFWGYHGVVSCSLFAGSREPAGASTETITGDGCGIPDGFIIMSIVRRRGNVALFLLDESE